MRTIVCVKWGTKYPPSYVNTLYNMCKRHNSVPFNFICLTENSHNINPDIEIKPLPSNNLHSWWFKPYVFSKELGLKGEVLFIDLDVVIFRDMEKLWQHKFGSFTIIRDFTRHMNPNWHKFNSSLFRFNASEYHWIWEDFNKNHTKIMSKNYGDQDYLFSILHGKALVWPDNWIQSYKWEMRDKNELSLVNGKRNFVTIKEPKLSHECCIAVFHGDPKPSEVKDEWVKENWK